MKILITQSINRNTIKKALINFFVISLSLNSSIGFSQIKSIEGPGMLPSANKKYIYAAKSFLPDSVIAEYYNLKKRKFDQTPFSINEISTINIKYGKGGLRGATTGALWGAITGIGVGTVLASTPDAFGNKQSHPDYFIPCLITMPISTLIGLISGNKKHKIFVLNGNLESYRQSIEQMNVLVTHK